MAANPKPHPANVPGPYYVEDECCTACGVPEHLAPELFGSDAAAHCFVKRQPETSTEKELMLRVLATQELGCIRYRGNERSLLRRLGEMGEGSLSDVPPPASITPIRRDHVSFSCIESDTALTAVEVLSRLVSYLATRPARYRTTTISPSPEGAALSVCWYEDQFHRIEAVEPVAPNHRFLVRHDGPIRFSDTLHDWLLADGRVGEVHWQTRAQWKDAGAWHRVPW